MSLSSIPPSNRRLTINTVERLAKEAANETQLRLKLLSAISDSNLLWEITFSGDSDSIVTVAVDAHDFDTEDRIRKEIKEQILRHLYRHLL